MLETLLLAALIADATVQSQHLDVRVDPATNHVTVRGRYDVEGEGPLRFRLNEAATIRAVLADDEELLFTRAGDVVTVNLTGGEETLSFLYEATFEQDVEQGEIAGQIHNFSVSAHVGPEGVFLSDGSAWHPQWIDADHIPHLLPASVTIEPIDEWSFVASGNPQSTEGSEITDPVWSWRTPRPVDGIALTGNRHTAIGRVHETIHGPVEVVMHAPASHRPQAEMFVDAACEYLDLYVPLLGPFPYERFSIIENFFSSGFAYPGFTLLGPQVVGMAPRSLAPGYLDHELVHNWWGNGVYVDPRGGNWCEALTTYCANYYRRIAEEGPDAGRDFRRGIIMKASSDPATLDNAAVDRFGLDPHINRFVGYDKGAFVFIMLEFGAGVPDETPDRSDLFAALMRFAHDFMGKRASWDDLQASIEQSFGEDREPFFDLWVRRHTVPETPATIEDGTISTFFQQYSGFEVIDIGVGHDEEGDYKVLDPEFRVYRILPPEQIIPTIAGTTGKGGTRIETMSARPEVESYLARMAHDDKGENLLLIGREAIQARADLIERTPNPIAVAESAFEVGGTTYAGAGQAVLHSMPHPDRPGRFITVFHVNGDAGWSRLRLVNFYTRDSTVVWEDGRTTERTVFEPSRRLYEGD